jgi:hypothetical protein
MSVERSIRVCAHKGQAKITPGRDDTRAIFNDVTSRRSFFPGSKAFLRRPTIIATYDAKLTRDLSSSVKGRAAFCSTIVIAHFSTTKTTFQPRVCVEVSERCDFNRSVGFRDYSRFVSALSRGEKPVCNAISDALVDNRLRKDAVSTGIEFPDYSEYPSSDNLVRVTSVERWIRVCVHKGQAKITPRRDDARAIFNDVTSRRSFLSRIKGVFAAGDDNCHLRRQINARFVIIRQRTCCVLLDDRYHAFFNDKNHFSTGFQPRLCPKTRFQQVGRLSRFFAVYSAITVALFHAFRTRWLINRLRKDAISTGRVGDGDRVPGLFRVPVSR